MCKTLVFQTRTLPDLFSFRERAYRIKNPTRSLPSQNQGDAPYPLLALLALPLLLTLQKLVVLLAYGDPSHHALAGAS
jgi:hypothetical protein